MGIGRATGENRAQQAARRCIASPMLETSMEGARGGAALHRRAVQSQSSTQHAAMTISEHADPDANVIFGPIVDDALGKRCG